MTGIILHNYPQSPVAEKVRVGLGIKGLDIRGADMVEVSPPFDVGGITALNGATVMYELLCVMAA